MLALHIIAFGLYIPFLGFYWDDWPVILTGRLQGAPGYLAFYEHDRPISAVTFITLFPILGSHPVVWHIFTLLLRWLTSVALWWTLTILWPARRREATWTALLFAIYPVFTQQSISVAYSQHWICYLLFFISLGLMIKAHRTPRLFWGLTAVAMAASLMQMLMMEYFAGLELLRPLILWVLAAELSKSKKPLGQPEAGGAAQSSRAKPPFLPGPRLRWVLQSWLPYLITLTGFVIWRLFFLEFPGEEANAPVLLRNIRDNPGEGIVRFLQIAIQDAIHLMINVWANILSPTAIQLRDGSILFSWGVGMLTAAALAVFLWQMRKREQWAVDAVGTRWTRQAMLLGLAALLLGMLPVWFTDRQIIVGTYSNRFGLPGMLGASLLAVALITEIIRRPIQRLVLLCLLVGLAVGFHLRVANDYRWSWVRQTRFYWQLHWRAPYIEPGTAIFSEGEIFRYVGWYSHTAAINLLYPHTGDPTQLDYWFSSLGRDYLYATEEFKRGLPIDARFRHYNFNGHTQDGIFIFYNPEHDCLKVLVPEDANVPEIPDITRQLLGSATTDRIQAGPPQPGYPPEEIFGPEPEHTWCYFFQKADLARQFGDWDQVVALGDDAREAGYDPKVSASNTTVEWMPFIEGYARLGLWDDAEALSLLAYEQDKRIDARLCNLWTAIEESTPSSQARENVMRRVRSSANCPQ